MKVSIFEVINNPLPKLAKLKTIEVQKKEFLKESSMVKIMNKYCNMDKLYTEHAYAIGLTAALYPKGILLCNIGDCKGVDVDDRTLATGLLLMGAERFYFFHNHPGYVRTVTQNDIELTKRLELLGDLIGVELDEHIMITKGWFAYCRDNDEPIPFS